MTTSNWPARLTPFTGGAALALLILGLVVDPARAGTLECRQCLYTWRWEGPAAANACAGKPKEEYDYCRGRLVEEKCRRPHPPAAAICATPGSGGSPYKDCASAACSNLVPCGAGDSTTYCTDNCAGCDQASKSCNTLLIDHPPETITVSSCYNYCGCGSTP